MKVRKSFICLLIVISMFVSFVTPVFAQVKTEESFVTKSTEYLEPEDNDGIYLIENIMIDGKDYTFIHRETETERTIEISGAENEVISFNKISEELKTKKDINLLNSGWTYFGPETFRVSWKKAASVAVIAGAIAAKIGSPIGILLGAAGTLAGVSVGCTAIKSGKYKIEGNHVEGHYKSEIYDPQGEYITTVHWSGRR